MRGIYNYLGEKMDYGTLFAGWAFGMITMMYVIAVLDD
jgi:hypothetical protein